MRQILFSSLIALLCIVSATAQSAHTNSGGNARLTGLGFNPFVDDITYLQYNPAHLFRYRNVAWTDINNNSSGNFTGLTVGITNTLTLGLMIANNGYRPDHYLARNIINLSEVQAAGRFQFPNEEINAIIKQVIMAGVSVKSDNSEFGLAVSTGYSKSEYNFPLSGVPLKRTNNFLIGVAGAASVRTSASSSIDATLSYQYADASAVTSTRPDNSAVLQLLGVSLRASYRLKDNLSLIPFINFAGSGIKNKRPSTISGITSVKEYNNLKGSFFSTGLGGTYSGTHYCVAGGLIYSENNIRRDSIPNFESYYKNITRSFPALYISAEWYTTEWLTLRMGTINTQSATTLDRQQNYFVATTENTFSSEAVSSIFLGAGFHFSDINLNLSFSPELILKGLNNLADPNGQSFGAMSVSYSF